MVVLSCGINDLTHHQYTARSLTQFIQHKLRDYSVRFPNVVFIVNSLLYTTDKYFNREVSIYNREMFDFSDHNEKVWFFDSHHIVAQGQNPLDIMGNGIHIAYHAKKLISTMLRDCITKFIRRENDLHRVWPLRPVYRHATLYL